MGATNSTIPPQNWTFPSKLEEDEILSKARFLKTHRCHDETGIYVVKTFFKPLNFTFPKDIKTNIECLLIF